MAGYMDLLKNAMGISTTGDEQHIDQDNKHYVFRPGKDGTLTATKDDNDADDKGMPQTPTGAKVIGPSKPMRDAFNETAATRG